jgi:choloylglycine hydrolase
MKAYFFLLGILVATVLNISTSFACTDFRLTAKDGTVLITRSMEFGLDLKSNFRSSLRNREFTTKAPDGNPGLSWKAKYGYIFLDGMNFDATTDGMNEQGLSFEALYLPGLAHYQTVPTGQNAQALPYIYIGDWILSNFKTVDEVREALATVYVFEQKLPELGEQVFPLHFSVFDPSGKGLIIEYIDGKLHLYDNKLGLLTNSPTYDWHLTNLDNYVHLRPVNPPAIKTEGLSFAATGQGFGMVGLPGDISPPSRFVKTAVLLDVTLPPEDSLEALNLAEHIINNVDIPRGLSREPQSGKYIDETTQWVVFKDLHNKILYYRTYHNMTLHAIELSKVDFSEKAARLKMPIANKQYVDDQTDEFLESK